jgi:hypothetical protein
LRIKSRDGSISSAWLRDKHRPHRAVFLFSAAAGLGAVKKDQNAVAPDPAKTDKQVYQCLLVVQVRQRKSAHMRN